jgi:hypothetical protein
VTGGYSGDDGGLPARRSWCRYRERKRSESESVNEEREHEIEVDRDWIERGEGVRGRNRSKELKP